MSDLKHRKGNFAKALGALQRSLATPVTEERDLAGIVKHFEIVYELSWKMLKHQLASEGIEVHGPKSAFEKAYQNNLIDGEGVWLAMIKDRNQTVHTYNEAFAKEMIERIRKQYVPLYEKI